MLASEVWTVDRKARNRIYDAIRATCAEAGIQPADVELYGVGTGPGNYSGLRVANSVVHGLAQPSGTPVIGINTGESLTEALLADQSGNISIVGDARRNRIWLGRFSRQGALISQTQDWRLVDLKDLPTDFGPDEIIAGPDWETIGEALSSAYPEKQLITAPAIPDAEQVARLAVKHFRRGAPYPSSDILYIHPAVFVEPKFPKV